MKKIEVGSSSDCFSPCSGLILTSFFKSTPKENLENILSDEVAAYDKYMKWFKYPLDLKGFI